MSKNNNFRKDKKQYDNNKGGYPKKDKLSGAPFAPRNEFVGARKNFDQCVSNDINYYNKSPLYERASKFLWNKVAGRPLPYEVIIEQENNRVIETSSEIGYIMRVDVDMGIGWCHDNNDPINVAFQNIMAQMYAMTASGSSFKFERADLAFMMTAISSITNMIGVAKRALECRNMWVAENAAYPRAIVGSMGFDLEDLVKHASVYANTLDYLIGQVNAMEVMQALDIYPRQYALCHSLYVDEDSPLAQLTYFMPRGYYTYEYFEGDLPKCVYHLLPNTRGANVKLGDFLDIIQEAINSWRFRDDYYNITGTIRRSFKNITVLRLDPVKPSIPNIVHDPVIYSQLMNATIIPTLDNLDITQKDGNVIFTPTITSELADGLYIHSPIIRGYEYNPDSAWNMEATRLVNVPYTGASVVMEGFKDLRLCGPEIVRSISIARLSSIGSARDLIVLYDDIATANYVNIDLSGDLGYAGSQIAAMLRLSQFRYIPTFTVTVYNGADNFALRTIVGDIYNYTTLEYNDFVELQRAALTSLYTLPDIK